MKKLFIVLSLCAFVFAPVADVMAKGGGGGRGGGGARSTATRSAPAPSKPVNNSGSTPSAPAQTPKTITKTPPRTVESTKPVVSSTGKKMNSKGTVVDDNYKPTFRGGFTPPAGATVYYPQRDFMDYLPWIFLFTQDSHREVVVETKGENGEVKQETHQEEGVDTMYIINWIMSILLLGGLIYLIMRALSKKKKPNVETSYRRW